MTKIITDNSKVNINLLKENELLKKQVEKLLIDKEKLTKQLNLCGVSKRSEPLNVFLVGDNVYFGHKKAKVIYTSVRYVDIKLINGKMYQGVPVSVIRHA